MPDTPTFKKELELFSRAETDSIGRRLGKLLLPGDTVLLTGDLGAGKTTLTQSIARGLGVPEESYVSSPSFSLMHEYPGRYPLYHFDCYRLEGEDDIEGAGLSEYLATQEGVSVIEWADRLGTLTPDDPLTIEIILLEGERRRMIFTSTDGGWKKRMEILCTPPDSGTGI